MTKRLGPYVVPMLALLLVAGPAAAARERQSDAGVRDISGSLVERVAQAGGVPTGIFYFGDIAGRYDDQVEMAAVLFEWGTWAPIQGRLVYFRLTDDESFEQIVTAVTDQDGIAETTLRIGAPAGEYFVDAIFLGDDVYDGDWDWDFFDVFARHTALAYQGPSSVQPGSVEVRARLRDSQRGTGVQGRQVSFVVTEGGSQVGAGVGVTAADGVASATIDLSGIDDGTVQVQASFGGDGFFAGSSVTASLSVESLATALAYSGPTAVVHDEQVSLTARLTDAAGGSVVGSSVRFEILGDGSELGSATGTTDGGGMAGVSMRLDHPVGDYLVRVSFAGDAGLLPSSTQADLRIDPRPTVVTYEGPGSVVRGTTATLAAALHDGLSGQPVSGQLVRFRIGALDETVQTGSDGIASLSFAAMDPYGDHEVEVSYAGSETRLPDTHTGMVSIVWERQFQDQGGAGTVNLNTNTNELQFVGTAGPSPVKTDPDMRVDDLSAARLVTIAFHDEDLSLVGQFDTRGELTSSPAFYAVVRTDDGVFVLHKLQP